MRAERLEPHNGSTPSPTSEVQEPPTAAMQNCPDKLYIQDHYITFFILLTFGSPASASGEAGKARWLRQQAA